MDILPFVEQLRAVPEFANLGNLFKSSTMPVELTESETRGAVRQTHVRTIYGVPGILMFMMQCNSCYCICDISTG